MNSAWVNTGLGAALCTIFAVSKVDAMLLLFCGDGLIQIVQLLLLLHCYITLAKALKYLFMDLRP
jgi:hypothetical protein